MHTEEKFYECGVCRKSLTLNNQDGARCWGIGIYILWLEIQSPCLQCVFVFVSVLPEIPNSQGRSGLPCEFDADLW